MANIKRSPKYPFISIGKAIIRARELYDKEGQNAANYKVALKHWDYGPKSSGGLQTIGALKNYGLLKDENSGDARSLYLTQLAIKILLDKRTDSIGRLKAIQEASLKPKIFADLWGKKIASGLPSNENLEYYLTVDRGYNENTAGDIVKKFKETIEFSRLSSSDVLEEQKRDKDTEVFEQVGGTVLPVQTPTSSQIGNTQPVGKQVGASIPVTQVCSMSIIADGPVTQKGIDKLVTYLELIKGSFPEKDSGD